MRGREEGEEGMRGAREKLGKREGRKTENFAHAKRALLQEGRGETMGYGEVKGGNGRGLPLSYPLYKVRIWIWIWPRILQIYLNSLILKLTLY